MLVNREAFLKALENVESGVDSKERLEQSSCVIFQNERVYSYNDEISCNCPSGLSDNFKVAVKAKPLIEMCRKLPDEELKVVVNGNTFVVRGKGKKTTIRTEQEIKP